MLKNIPQEHEVARSAELLGAMANAKRLLILSVLTQHEISVSLLAMKVGLSQSALSQHLAKLRHAGLVVARRDAQTVYYSSNSQAVGKLLDVLDRIYNEGSAQGISAEGSGNKIAQR
ncbi:metalloregulator ArsR/SmtB family transcription factor [Rhizobium sp. ZW T2_16]|uniref:ArsR/SmtB family transcription factor n=1 Tax=Rhizobium sp. ZW T2_16 TaxID=3378083 RepID=UPI0016145204